MNLHGGDFPPFQKFFLELIILAFNRRLSEHFYARDFCCSCGQCLGSDSSQVPISLSLIHELEVIQNSLDVPIRIISGYRCKNRNHELTGFYDGEHCKGNAADISVDDISSNDYLKLIYLCWNNSVFSFVSVFDRYIHVDVGHSRSRPRVNKSKYEIKNDGVAVVSVSVKDMDFCNEKKTR